MKRIFIAGAFILFAMMAQAQNIGIGTPTPVAKLNIVGVGSNPTIPGTTTTGVLRIGTASNEGIDVGKAGFPTFAAWMQVGFNGTITDGLSLQPLGGNVGIGTMSPTAKLHVNGAMKIDGLNTLEFGAGVEGKELNAGKIGYNSFGFDGLSIVGSGTTAVNRKVYIFAEGGTTFNGQVKILGGTPAAGKVLTSDATGLASWQTLSLSSNTPSVSICCQSWMTKNLDVDTYRNGDPIPQVTDQATWASLTTGAWCYYNNSASNNATYGKLYNWYAVNDPRGLAPEGWHIPTDFEWTTLENCLGGAAVAGGALKEIGTTLWATPNSGATNISGWRGLPGGFRNITSFFNVTIIGSWWSSTESSASGAYVRGIDNSDGNISSSINTKTSGNSVRCIRD